MEKQTSLIYTCPYCRGEVWFHFPSNLMYHLYTDHLQELLRQAAQQQKRTAVKTRRGWKIQK